MIATVNHPATPLGFEDPSAVAESWWSRVPNWVLLAGIAAGDATAFYLTAALAMRDAEWYVIALLIAAMSAASVATMHFAGKFHRQARAHHGGPRLMARAVLVATWLALGLSAFWIRYNDNAGQASDVDAGGFDVSSVSNATDLPFAVLLFVLYVAGGLVAYYLAFTSYNPFRLTLVRLERRNRRIRRNLQRLRKKRARRTQGGWWQRKARRGTAPDDGQDVLAELDAAHSNGRDQLAAQADQLKLAARTYLTSALAQQQAEDLRQAALEDERSRDVAAEAHDVDENARLEREENDRLQAKQREIDHALAVLADEDSVRSRLQSLREEHRDLSAQFAGLPTEDALEDDFESPGRALLEAQAGQLREEVRHELASALRDPAATTGVFFEVTRRSEV